LRIIREREYAEDEATALLSPFSSLLAKCADRNNDDDDDVVGVLGVGVGVVVVVLGVGVIIAGPNKRDVPAVDAAGPGPC